MSGIKSENQPHAHLPEYLEAVPIGRMEVGQMRCIGWWRLYVDKERRLWLDPEVVTVNNLCDEYSVIVERREDGYAVDVSYVEGIYAEWELKEPEEFDYCAPYAKPGLIKVVELIDNNERRGLAVMRPMMKHMMRELKVEQSDG